MADVPKARDLLTQAQAALADAPAPPPPATPPPPTPVPTTVVRAGQNHQAIIEAAPAGTVVALEPATYLGTVRIPRGVTLQPTVGVPAGRRAAAFAPVTFLGSDVATVQHTNPTGGARLIGITVKNTNPDYQLLDDVGTGLFLDRVALLGDPVKGQHRGLAANGVNAQIRQSLIDDCFLSGRDAQAIMGWSGTNGLIVDDCALYGGAETVMFGGAAGATPQNIVIKNSLLSKKRAWYAAGVQIKNAFEVKNGMNITVLDSVLEYGGIAEGQGGYVIVLTPRNQDNDTPGATVRNVTIERNVVRHGAGGVSFLGRDDGYPSDVLDGVTIRNVLFDDLGAYGPWGTGSGWVFTFNNNPRHVTLDSLTVRGTNLWAAGYFMPAAPTGLVMRNIVMPPTVYSWKIDAGGSGIAALRAFAPDAQIALTAGDLGASGYPSAA